MLQTLYNVEAALAAIVLEQPDKTMYIDYHDPYVKRIMFKYRRVDYEPEVRVFLHKIYPCNKNRIFLWHPHPWHSAVRIIKGSYEMGVGYSETNECPKIASKLILGSGSCYEMTEPHGWHYVNPIDDEPVYSLMVVGELNGRKMPIEPKKEFRSLTPEEYNEIMQVFAPYYDCLFFRKLEE